MEWLIISTVLAFSISIITIVTPIIKLNNNITKLNVNMEMLNDKFNFQDANIQTIVAKIENHEIRIDRLEHKK